MNLHHPSQGGGSSAADDVDGNSVDDNEEDEEEDAEKCGPINVEAMQQVMAAKWAVDVINNQSLPHELNIGKHSIPHLLYNEKLRKKSFGSVTPPSRLPPWERANFSLNTRKAKQKKVQLRPRP